jgi:hypothetical protein
LSKAGKKRLLENVKEGDSWYIDALDTGFSVKPGIRGGTIKQPLSPPIYLFTSHSTFWEGSILTFNEGKNVLI